jgi:hypothetical protein
MRAKLFLLFAALQVCAFSAAAQSVIENQSSVVMNERAADVSLVIDAKQRSSVAVALSIVDADNTERASSTQAVKLDLGRRKYRFQVPLGNLMKDTGDEIAWYRLRYRVGDIEGIASLSELMRDDFDLRAAAFERIVPGQTLRLRVRALNPVSERAVKDVTLKAELVISLDTDSDDDEQKLIASARTNGDGFATLGFKIPANITPAGDAEVLITGQKNGVVRKIDEDFDEDQSQGTVVMTTDKPLYQPGQAFNLRALYFDPNNTVVPDNELEFTIEDEEDTPVFRQTVSTSAFGIAAISWQIPENAKLGSYCVEIETDNDINGSELCFKVTRYDLPNFSVSVKPDRTYYLLTDTQAQITVTADYLFGKPVTKGKVRVVQEGNRRWNYREQKYDIEEGDAVEGDADASGIYVTHFDLKAEIAKLRESEWERYRDLSFSAHYTDTTTNRTEQRRFDIRLTKEPIHIYLIRYADQHPDLPLRAYISTFYADGTPANCNVEIRDRKDMVARLRSNGFGAGKLEIDIPKDRPEASRYEIQIIASDKKGQRGTFEESFGLETDEHALQIRINQAIFKPGEMIEADLRSTQQSGMIYVDVVKGWTPVDSHVAWLSKGRARITIPYKPEFKGELTVAAYSDRSTYRLDNNMRASTGIIFPEQQNLILNAKFSKDAYKPGEKASVRFSIADGARRPVESAIGLGIFDKAIEERARTETEFGGYFSRFGRLLGYDRSFGSLTVKDLNELDLSRPISPEMQLAGEIVLAGRWYYPTIYHSRNLDTEARSLYLEHLRKQLEPVSASFEAQFKKNFDHPVDMVSLKRILTANNIDLESLRDPWGNEYIAEFAVDKTQDVVTLKTVGPDKKAGSPDDFSVLTKGFAYFSRLGESIDRAQQTYFERTNSYIRDAVSLTSELRRLNVDLSNLRDRWGRDYNISFEVSGRYYVIRVAAAGPNGIFATQRWNSDDFEVWRSSIDYFGKTETEINRILDTEVNLAGHPFPRTEEEFKRLLAKHGLAISEIKDGFGRSVFLGVEKQTRYADRTKIENGKTTVTPVSEEILVIKVKSLGEDPSAASDDRDLAIFSGVITAAHKGTGFAKADVKTVTFAGARGAIRGFVVDPNGAVIPGVKITATNELEQVGTFETQSDDEGKFLISNLPSGRYRVTFDASGFKRLVQESVTVRSQTAVEINVTLQVGAVAEMVAITASADTVNATDSQMSTNITKKDSRVQFPYKEQTSTPRLREYFPETLVWQPELLTDKKGRAELSFKMADNITTWKMFAIASDKKGKVGVVEKEVTAFQSFFVDLDPPKFLTAGDEIYLPTQVRNYTEKYQRVDVTMDKADWFTFLGRAKQQVTVPIGASENAVFGFKAVTAVKAGKQRVTAIAHGDSDAIEKPVTVRPDGKEIVRTESKVFNGSVKLEIDFPSNALAGTQKAEVKVYPNLFSHVADSVEGLLQRPYGCGEQTISSTYPNLMVLKFVKQDSALRQKAEKYLRKGYERLIGYQVADGGFTYWGGKDTSDDALTAYALRFLTDAKGFIDVDEESMKRAEEWLIRQQRSDGSWTKQYSGERSEDRSRTKMLTTYVVRTLAMLASQAANGESTSKPSAALTKGLDYLKQRNAEIEEPYAMALFGLASIDAGDIVMAKQIAAKLETLAIDEGSAAYWKLETNTPFYGWGTAGRVETTALVINLLTRVAKLEGKASSDASSRGLLFLLQNKDRYGVWHSTQTTINVLDAFLALLNQSATPQSLDIQIVLNGSVLETHPVTADRIDPVVVDLTGKVLTGPNSIEIRRVAGSPLMAQTVATHYIDWQDSKNTNVDAGQSRALRLDYKCDRPNPAIMQEVSCSVEAERIGFRGYGMLLAEIGTPPGADVSRESLEAALAADWSLSRYDILPDRIVLYMWSKAGGTKFNFKFRPRYGINAQTPASIVYDYYNPEANETVEPLRFATK